RVGLVDGKMMLFPSQAELKTSELDLVVAGTDKSVLMIEGFADQLPEDQMLEALAFGHSAIRPLCEMQNELVQKVGVPPKTFAEPPANPLVGLLRNEVYGEFRQAKTTGGKHERAAAVAKLKKVWEEKLFPAGAETTS